VARNGRPPTPTALKILRGETRPSRINRQEPIPVGELVPVPDDLNDEAKVVWRRVVHAFGHTGVIRSADSDVMRLYCEAVARYERASRLLDQSGPIIRGRQGDMVKNPLHQIVRDNATLVRSLAGELGLTPAARVGLKDANGRPTPASTTLQRLQAKRTS